MIIQSLTSRDCVEFQVMHDEDEAVRAAAGFVWEVYMTLLHICYGVRNDEENYLDIDNTCLIFWFE